MGEEAGAGHLDLDQPFAVKGFQAAVRARFQPDLRTNIDYFEATMATKQGAFLRARAFPENTSDLFQDIA